MPRIHESAVIDGEVTLADDVEVGPGAVLRGSITIGAGSRIIGSAWLQGPLTIGRNNTIYPFACLGFAPQHRRFDPATPGLGTTIGDDNTFREGVTIHRAFTDNAPTTIGDDNYLMANSHVGHDCQLGNTITLVQGVALGGHVTIEDQVTIGGNSVVHQQVRVGRGAMLSGGMGTSLNLPPWFMLTGFNIAGSINLIGLRRSGMSREEIDDVRWVYRTLYRSGLTIPKAIERLREKEDRPMVQEYLQFFERSGRSICPAVGKPSRGISPETTDRLDDLI